jgi:diguanylate cyclase (GGDEF)-like protein
MSDHEPRNEDRLRAIRNRIAALVLLLAVLPVFRIYALAERFEARLFDEADGLANLSITSFAQQPDGHLWIGTVNGVFRYDGSAFTGFSRSSGLSDPSVFSLLIDRTGALWAGTHGGLFWFDGNMFHEVRLDQKSLRIGVNSMMTSTSTGELVVETFNGMVSIEREPSVGTWQAVGYRQRHPSFPDNEDTDGIAVDGKDRLWFGCNAKLCSYSGNTLHTFGPAQGVAKDFYVSIFVARNGQIWARGRTHILTWRPGDAQVQDLTGSFPRSAIVTVNRRFTEDAAGRILTPTASGFAAWDGRSWTETVSTGAGALEGATDIFCDRENSLWIGTDGAGLFHSLGYGLWSNYSTAEGLGNASIGAIGTDRAGRIWVGHNRGANILMPGSGQVIPSPLAAEKDAAFIQSFAPDPEGGMWAAGLLGRIFHINASGRVDARYSVDAYITRILLDRNGLLWIATGSALYTLQCQGKSCKIQPFESAQLDKGGIGDMALAVDNSLWVASRHGLDRIQGSAVTHIEVPGHPTELSLLRFAPDGTLWLSGRLSGVFRVRVQGLTAHTLDSYNTPQLISDFIEILDIDSKGRLWIGTDRGINVLQDGKIFLLTDEDGLIRNDAARKAFLSSADGSVWIGTGKGISHLLDPGTVLKRPPFSAVIEDAHYREKSLLADPKLRWNEASLSLRFSGLTFRDNRKLVYHYQLIGFDSAETVAKNPGVSYPKLPPGSYTFRVYAQDAGNGVMSAPAELQFTLTPPWWRTAWFESLAVVLFFGLVAALWYVLHLAILAQSRRLQRMVKERTGELEQMAMHDMLTGLPNRRDLFAALGAELESAHRHQSDLCLAIIDLDHFKRVNDTHGHLAGDEVLRQAAKRLTAVARSSDIVGRYGGEEFLVIFKNAKHSLGLERCESIRMAMCAQPIRYLDQELTVTCSIGIAWTQRTPAPAAKLLAAADRALYSAKNKGRNQVQCIQEDAKVLSIS